MKIPYCNKCKKWIEGSWPVMTSQHLLRADDFLPSRNISNFSKCPKCKSKLTTKEVPKNLIKK